LKKAVALILVFTVLLMLSAPAAFADDNDAVYAFESVELTDYKMWSAGDILSSDIPEWLIGIVSGNYSSGSSDMTPCSAEDNSGYEPRLNVPYEIRATKTFYNKKGEPCYVLVLSAVFVDTSIGTFLIKSNAYADEISGSWKITAGKPKNSQNTVSADFEVSQLFTGIPIKTETVTLELNSLSRASSDLPMGDIDLSGDITSFDARNALRAAVKLEELSVLQTILADIDGDGKITASDARGILRKSVGL